MKALKITPLGSAALLLVVFLTIGYALTNPEHGTSSETSPSGQDSPAFRLAALHLNQTNPSAAVTAQFASVLDVLQRNCPDASVSDLSDHVHAGWSRLHQTHESISLLEFAKGVEIMIAEVSPGVADCTEAMKVLATMTAKN